MSRNNKLNFRAMDLRSTYGGDHQDVLDYLHKMELHPTSHGHFVTYEGVLVAYNHVKCMIKRDIGPHMITKLEAVSKAVLWMYEQKKVDETPIEIHPVKRMKGLYS